MSGSAKKDHSELESAVKEYVKSRTRQNQEAVVKAAEPLVSYFASLYSPGRIDEDLYQAGYEGLLKALHRYDPSRRTMFSTYASHCIIGEIRHELRDRGPFRVPDWIKGLQTRIINATDELAQKNGAMPSLADIAHRVNVTEEGIVEAIQVGCVSLDEVDISKLKHIRYENFKLPIEDRIAVQMSLEKMDRLQRDIIKMIYYEGLTQQETAKKLGLNQRKVSRLLNKGLKEMRLQMV